MTGPRFDRTLRVVMWVDAFVSLAAVALCIVALPAIAVLDLSSYATTVVGIAAILSALLLAACGAVTGVVLLVRMGDGDYRLPRGLRLPLPRVMRPEIE